MIIAMEREGSCVYNEDFVGGNESTYACYKFDNPQRVQNQVIHQDFEDVWHIMLFHIEFKSQNYIFNID